MLKISLFYSCFWISLQIHNWDKWCHLVSGKAFVYKRQNAIGSIFAFNALLFRKKHDNEFVMQLWKEWKFKNESIEADVGPQLKKPF